MAEKLLVTVIIPIYNAEEYLESCINSVLRQTYSELEIILIDDGSTDHSPQICEKYSEEDSRIRVLHIQNSGVANARNVGISKARGSYLAFVDSDDFVHKEYIQKMVEGCQKYNADVCIVQYARISAKETEGSICWEKFKTTGKADLLTGVQASYLLYEKEYCAGMIVPWGKLFRRSLFDNMRFSNYRIYEDEAFIYKLIFNAAKLVRLEDVLYMYRNTPESIITKKFSEDNLVLFQILRERVRFYEEKSEKALCNLTLNRLYFTYAEYYNKAKQNLNNPENILKKLRREQFGLYKEMIRNRGFSAKRKMKYTLALLLPEQFYKVFYK